MARAADSDPVDVLIIGAGASGAAVAWSLAETKMRIVCFEQGDWMNPAEYPTNQQNWESQAFGPYHINPNVRGRDTDYPINNNDSPIHVVNFNGVGGGTIMYAAHFPRLHPSDFKVKTLDGVADELVEAHRAEPEFGVGLAPPAQPHVPQAEEVEVPDHERREDDDPPTGPVESVQRSCGDRALDVPDHAGHRAP